MILSVTVLGSNDGTSLSVIGQRIVEYLEGGRSVAGGRRPGVLVELPSPEGGTVAYYADSAGLRPGRWVLGRSGEVDPAELATLLAGVEPATGEPLISARGSARRAERTRRLALAPTPSRQGVVLDQGGCLGPRDHSFVPPPPASGAGRGSW